MRGLMGGEEVEVEGGGGWRMARWSKERSEAEAGGGGGKEAGRSVVVVVAAAAEEDEPDP